MPIVSSAITEDSPQRDGRRWIAERHVDQLGVEQIVIYMSESNANVAAAMAARVAGLNAALIGNEIDANIASVAAFGRDATVVRNHSTVPQNAAALRKAYRNATRLDAVMIGDYLSTLTDGQLQAAFGITAGQATALRTRKLTPAATQAAAIRAAAGE